MVKLTENHKISMCKRVSRFDFEKADVDGMILQLSAYDWSDLLRDDCVDECVQKFYDAIYECFELYIPKYIVKNSTVKYPWFDKELTTLIITEQRQTNT
jgi:hypothetical protein